MANIEMKWAMELEAEDGEAVVSLPDNFLGNTQWIIVTNSQIVQTEKDSNVAK